MKLREITQEILSKNGARNVKDNTELHRLIVLWSHKYKKSCQDKSERAIANINSYTTLYEAMWDELIQTEIDHFEDRYDLVYEANIGLPLEEWDISLLVDKQVEADKNAAIEKFVIPAQKYHEREGYDLRRRIEQAERIQVDKKQNKASKKVENPIYDINIAAADEFMENLQTEIHNLEHMESMYHMRLVIIMGFIKDFREQVEQEPKWSVLYNK